MYLVEKVTVVEKALQYTRLICLICFVILAVFIKGSVVMTM